MGSVGGSPISADSGQLFTIAHQSGTPGPGADGFTISPAAGTAYLNNGGGLYTLDLTTGVATLVGALRGPIFPIGPITVQPVPEPGSGLILAIGLPCLLGSILRGKITNSGRRQN